MIVVYAGRRPSGPDGAFPDDARPLVAERLRLLVAGLRPRRLFGSAAAGADLLVLEAAAEAGIGASIYVAGPTDAFREASVEDKGQPWTSMFDACTSSPDTDVIQAAAAADDAGFVQVSKRMLADAEQQLNDDEELVVVAVSEGRHGDDDHTEDMLAAARNRGHLVLRLDPQKALARRKAFVAMPYGQRKLGRGRPAWQSDPTFHRVLAPAIIAAGYYPDRTDLQASTEVIDRRMIRDIATADLLVADLATYNPNVLWELGVRHAWRASRTVVVRPENSERIPFDLGRVPVIGYRRAAKDVADADAVSSIRDLLQVLESPPDGTDSPVFAALPGMTAPELGEEPEDEAGRDPRAEELDKELALAVALGDTDRVLAVARDEQVPPAMRVEAGFALIALGRSEAAEVLKPAAEQDTGFENELLQQQYAHALMRTGDPTNNELAERRLVLLDSLLPGSAETAGLLGSAAKNAWARALDDGHDGLAHLDRAVDAYLDGFRADPTDYYTGINAVMTLIARAHALPRGAEEDLAEARPLLPVVRFALDRPQVEHDAWWEATLGEHDLYDHLLNGSETVEQARRHYAAAVSSAGAKVGHVGTMRRQLERLVRSGAADEALQQVLAEFP